MQFKRDFFKNYLLQAPLSLAIERTLECQILSTKKFARPILDIGCGEGLFANILFDEKLDVGIDPNHKELKRAESYQAYKELIQCKGDNIPKTDGSFKTILSNSVMEHIPDIDKVLSEAHRLLSDDGVMYLSLPTTRFDKYTLGYQLLGKLGLENLQSRYQAVFNKFWCHYHYYDRAQWEERFQKHGFTVLECQEYGPKHTCMTNAAIAPLSIIPFITKKLSNQWFISSRLRKKTALILNRMFRHHIEQPLTKPEQGGLIFFGLVKHKKIEPTPS